MLKPIDSKGKNTGPYRILEHSDFLRKTVDIGAEWGDFGALSLNSLISKGKLAKTGFLNISVELIDFLSKTGEFGGQKPPLTSTERKGERKRKYMRVYR